MSQDVSASAFSNDRMTDIRLVKQINHALGDTGLRVRSARKGSLAEGLAGPYYIVYGKRAFQLRIKINELALALGVEADATLKPSPHHAAGAEEFATRLFANSGR